MTQNRRQVMKYIFGIGGAFVAMKSMLTWAVRPALGADAPPKRYECPPCGCPHDGKEFDKPGKCPSCRMTLREKVGGGANTQAGYICPPCGCKADGKIFPQSGRCPECKMALIKNPNART